MRRSSLIILGKSVFGKCRKAELAFSSNWVFFHEHHDSQEKTAGEVEGYPFYNFHPIHRHLDISQFIAAESSHLLIAGSRFQTEKL